MPSAPFRKTTQDSAFRAIPLQSSSMCMTVSLVRAENNIWSNNIYVFSYLGFSPG